MHRLLRRLPRTAGRDAPGTRAALPRAVCSAPPSVQSPRRLHRASRDGVDSPIAHTAGFTDLTARGGLGSHTRRSRLQGVPPGPMSCLFGAFRGQTRSGDCWTERISHRYTRIFIALSPHGRVCPAPPYARTRKKHRPTYARHTRNSAVARAKAPLVHDRYTPDTGAVRPSTTMTAGASIAAVRSRQVSNPGQAEWMRYWSAARKIFDWGAPAPPDRHPASRRVAENRERLDPRPSRRYSRQASFP